MSKKADPRAVIELLAAREQLIYKAVIEHLKMRGRPGIFFFQR